MEDVHTEDVHTEDVHTEDVHTEDVHTEHVHTEHVHTEHVYTKHVYTDHVNADQVHTEHLYTDPAAHTGYVNAYQVPTEHLYTDHAYTDYVITEPANAVDPGRPAYCLVSETHTFVKPFTDEEGCIIRMTQSELDHQRSIIQNSENPEVDSKLSRQISDFSVRLSEVPQLPQSEFRTSFQIILSDVSNNSEATIRNVSTSGGTSSDVNAPGASNSETGYKDS